MRLAPAEHAKHPWRVHALAKDFALLDVWRYPITADLAAGEDFALFCRLMDEDAAPPAEGVAGFLFRLRDSIGRALHLDDAKALPIPGCTETSLRERLEERAPGGPQDSLGFSQVYRLDDERLMELSNKTVHALLHVGWVHIEGSIFSPQLAVYAKTRGKLGAFYMALIAPFRHLIVYPAMMRAVKKKWAAATRT